MSEAQPNRRADTPVCHFDNAGEHCSGRQECPPSEFVPFRGLDFHGSLSRTERNLPHWEQDGACYYVTFRLGDSIPNSVSDQWRQEREAWEHHNPKPWDESQRAQFGKTFLRRQEQMLDLGEGECCLRRPEVRTVVLDSIKRFNDVRYDLDRFVVMPNHVHLLIQMRPGFRLDKELQGMKGASARRCNQLLHRTGKFWQAESWDRIVRSSDQLCAFRKYIENNPAKARLGDDEYRLEIYDALRT